MKTNSITLAASLLLGLPIALSTSATAQTAYPTRPIKLVMPIPAGTALDVVARLVGEPLSKNLDQTIVVENRPGGGGLVAAQAVASAPADGYTLLGGGSAIFTILPAQKDKLPIDVNRDLTQVGMLLTAAMYLAVAPGLNVKSMAEFSAVAKSQPQKIVIGTNGAGT